LAYLKENAMKTNAMKTPTLSQVAQAVNATTPSPRWHLTTTYNDWTVVLEIKYDAVETQTTLYVFTDGEAFEVLTKDELKERVELARQHGDEYVSDQVHAVSKHDALVATVLPELLQRWAALQYIVLPAYTM
jgi:hypothetical protein